MKRKSASSCCSSSSSSSCIAAPAKNDTLLDNNNANQTTKKPKRVRAKKPATRDDNNNSATTSPKSRSSVYRGVTRHRWTGRYEAHLWDKTTWNSIQNKRGRQIYLGAYDNEEDAARTYDLAALKYWGPTTILNFSVESHTKEIEEMQKMSNEEYLATLRRRSSGFSRGVSKYRGVARHHHNGRWEARIGRVSGNKYLYLGTYGTQEEAAAAYDMAAIEYRGTNAVTNFDISHYADKLKKLLPDQWQQAEREEHVQLAEEQTISPPDQPQSFQVPAEVASAVMGPPAEEHEHPWDLYLDTTGLFNSLALPDIQLDESPEALSWLGGGNKEFEDDDIFGCIFDGPLFGYDELFLGDTNELVVGDQLKGKDLPTSPSSSSLSTIASVCSNI